MNNKIEKVRLIVDDYINEYLLDENNIFSGSISENDKDVIIEKYSYIIRDNPGCNCDDEPQGSKGTTSAPHNFDFALHNQNYDEHCPHKSKISRLGLHFLYDTLRRTIKYDKDFIENFNPREYEIKYLTDNQEQMMDMLRKDNKKLYYRYEMEINHQNKGEYFEISRYFDIIEGFTFEENMDEFTMMINEQEFKFKIKNKKFFPNKFFIPIRMLPYASIKINCKKYTITGGNINPNRYDIMNYFETSREINFEYDDKKYILWITNGCGIMRQL